MRERALASIPFADHWAEPPPRGARYDRMVDVLISPPHELPAELRPASLVWRYAGEVNNGGHAQYFMNLEAAGWPDGLEVVPEATATLRSIGLAALAEVLDRALVRWRGAARLAPADLMEASAIFEEREFDDLDRAFYKLDAPAPPGTPPAPSRTSDALDREIGRLADEWIEVLPPEDTDRDLVATGAGGSSGVVSPEVWLRLARHARPRVRLRAAEALVDTHPDAARAALTNLQALGGVDFRTSFRAGWALECLDVKR